MTVFAKSFLRSLERLTLDQQALVKQAVFDLMTDPDRLGVGLRTVDGAVDPRLRSARVGENLQLIVFRDGGTEVLCYVGHRADAHEWAMRMRIEVVEATGGSPLVLIDEHVMESVRTADSHRVHGEPDDSSTHWFSWAACFGGWFGAFLGGGLAKIVVEASPVFGTSDAMASVAVVVRGVASIAAGYWLAGTIARTRKHANAAVSMLSYYALNVAVVMVLAAVFSG